MCRMASWTRKLRYERVEAARCLRMQCRFWACFLPIACIALYFACIYTVPTFPGLLLVSHVRGGANSFAGQPSYGLLQEPRAVSKEWSAGVALMKLGYRRPWRPSRKLLTSGEDKIGDREEQRQRVHGESMSSAGGGGGGGDEGGMKKREAEEASRHHEVLQRMGPGEGGRPSSSACSMEDIAIVQGEMGPMPDGIPSFAVQILNLCFGGCRVADIHVACGWFASATLVNPALFKRLAFDDCLVKQGLPLAPGETLTFHYANSFQFPFSLSSASFSCNGGAATSTPSP